MENSVLVYSSSYTRRRREFSESYKELYTRKVMKEKCVKGKFKVNFFLMKMFDNVTKVENIPFVVLLPRYDVEFIIRTIFT